MKDKKEPIVLDLDIFIHLMTSAVSQFRFGMADMLNEPESTVQH